MQDIESHLTKVSHSLSAQGQDLSTFNAPARQLRNESFAAIEQIKNNFTDYETWLYYDNQTTSINSAPGVGTQYTDSSSSINLNKNIIK